MIKIINGFKTKNFFNNRFSLNFFILLRYLPLLILSSDWILIENFGIYQYLGKLTIANLFKKLGVNIIFNILFFIIFLTVIIVFIIFALKFKGQKVQESEFKQGQQIKLVKIFFYIFYYFPSYVLEITFINSINIKPNFNNHNKEGIETENFVFKKINFLDIEFSIVGIFFSIIFLIVYFIFNYLFEKFLVTPHCINLIGLKGNIFDINYRFLLFPVLQGLLVLDLILDIENNLKIKVIIKLIFRSCFILYYLISFKKFHKEFPYSFEILLMNFSFFLCLIDFFFIDIFIKNPPTNSIFYLITNYNLNNSNNNNKIVYNNNTLIYSNEFFSNSTINSNNSVSSINVNITDSNYIKDVVNNKIFYDKNLKSLFFNSNEIYFTSQIPMLKLLVAGISSIFLFKIIEFYEIKYLSSFYESTKRSISSYFNKLFYFLKNLKKFSKNHISKILTHFIMGLKFHNAKCRLANCACGKSLEIFKDIFSIKNLDSRKILELFKKFTEENFIYLNKQYKNDSENLIKFELILAETFYSMYFKKYYITAFFKIDKLLKFPVAKKNNISFNRLNMLKLEIITKFLEKNKGLKNKMFLQLYSDYSYFKKFKELQEKSQNCFKFYKFIIGKFSDFNLKFNNIGSIETQIIENNENLFKSNSKYNKFQSKISETIHEENFFTYNFSEFERDLSKLKILIKSTRIDMKEFTKNKYNYNPIYFKNISIFTKFFLNKDLFKELYLSNLKLNTKRNKKNINILEEENLTESKQDLFFRKEIEEREENDWDKIILSNNSKNKLIFEKTSSRFAQDLGYKNNELVGMELNTFLPARFIDYHQNHVLDYLNRNNLIIENKEVYFLTKSGYCLNFFIKGTMILTLDKDFLIFCEVKKLNIIFNKYYEKAFLSCDLTGEIMAFDYGIFHHFFLDSNTIQILKPNLFKNFLNINSNNINYNSDNFVIEIDYLKILSNIQNLDFSKLIDVKSKEFEFSISRKLLNAIEHCCDGKVAIIFVKRNLLKKFYFYDVRMDISRVKKMGFIFNIPNEFTSISKKTPSPFIQSSISACKVAKEKIFNLKILENLKILTINNTNNKTFIIDNLKIYEKILIDFFDFNSKIKGEKENPLNREKNINHEKFEFKEVSKFIGKNNKIPFKEKLNKINFLNRLIFSIIFLTFFVIGYNYINLINDDLYNKGKTFLNFHLRTIILKNYILNLSNSFFSIFFLLNNLEPNNLKISDTIDNFDNLEFYYYQINNKSGLFLENAYFFQSIYSKYGSFLLKSENNINDEFLIKKLNSDWTVSEDNYTLYQNMYLFHYICKRINLTEIEQSKFLFFNYTENNYLIIPTATDLSLFFFMENILGDITINMDILINSENESYLKFQNNQINFIITIYSFSVVVGFIYMIYQITIYYQEFLIIYTKYFILFNSIKIFYVLLFKKLNTILIIFNDFTGENLNKIKRSNNKKLLKSKFSLIGLMDGYDINKIKENFDLNNIEHLNEIINNEYFKNLNQKTQELLLSSAKNLLSNIKINNNEDYKEILEKTVNSNTNYTMSNQKGKVYKENSNRKSIYNYHYLDSENNLLTNKNGNPVSSSKLVRKTSNHPLTYKSTLTSDEVNLNSELPDSRNYNSKFSNVLSSIFTKYKKKKKDFTKNENIKNTLGLSYTKSIPQDIIFENIEEVKEESKEQMKENKNLRDEKYRNEYDFESFKNEEEVKYVKKLKIPFVKSEYRVSIDKEMIETSENNYTNNRFLISSNNILNTEDKFINSLNQKENFKLGIINLKSIIGNDLKSNKEENQTNQKIKDSFEQKNNENQYTNSVNKNNSHNKNKNNSTKNNNNSKYSSKKKTNEISSSIESNLDADGDSLIANQDFFIIPQNFKFSINILLIMVILIFGAGIAVCLYVLSVYNKMSLNYNVSRNILSRYLYLNELFLIYRWSIVNKKEMKYIYKNGTVIDLFTNSNENYLNSFKYLENLKINPSNKNDFEYFNNLEINFNSKRMCDFYGFYLSSLNSTSEVDYIKYKKDCEILGGGINNFGIISAYNEMNSEIAKHYKDFVVYINTEKGQFSKSREEKWVEYVNEIFSDAKFKKIFNNLNEIFFNINEIYFKAIINFSDIFFENISQTHDLVHYNSFIIIVVSLIIFLIIIYYMIDKPLRLIKFSEKIIHNSILYNILDL